MMTNIRTSQVPEVSYKPRSLEAAPALSLFAIEGWACSSVRFNLRKKGTSIKRPVYKETQRNRRTKVTTSKSLPHGENRSPAGAPIGGPRTTPRQGPRPLEDRRWPWPSNFRLAGTETGAPAASLSFLGGRGAIASQWPRRLGPSMATHLRHRGRAWGDLTSRGHGRGVSTGAERSAWSLHRCFHPWSVDVASRRTLEDPVKARRHPLGVVAVIVAVSTIVVAGGFFLKLPPLPRFSSTRIQCLAVDVLLFLPFLC